MTKSPGPLLCVPDIIQQLNILRQSSVTLVELDNCVHETVTKLKSDLFQRGMGLMKGPPAHINLSKEINPKYFKACSQSLLYVGRWLQSWTGGTKKKFCHLSLTVTGPHQLSLCSRVMVVV